MRLKRLEILNFRNHQHSVLEMDASFICVRGSNFAGKSSVSQAISLLVAPSTMGLSADGKGFVTKIRRGTNKATIIGQIQGKEHLVEKTVELNVNTTGRTQSLKCLSDETWHPSPFERLLDKHKAALLVACNTDYFFGMDESKQKSLLSQLVLPAHYDFEESVMNGVDKALGEGVINFDEAPFVVIEKAYKKLYSEREAVNRQVKDFVVPDALPSVAVDVATLQSQLSAARDKQKQLSAERDAVVSANHEANLKQSKLAARVDALKDKINEENNRIERLDGFLSEAKLKDLRKVAEGKVTLENLEAERTLLYPKIERKKAKVEGYTKISGASGEECPTCHQEIDGETIADLHNKAGAELVMLQKRDGEILQEMKALGDVTGAVKAVAGHEISVKQKEEIQNVIAEKEKLLKDAEAELGKLPTVTDVLTPFVKPLDEVDAEITALVGKLQPAAAAEARKKEIEAKTAQLAMLTKKAASVDALVKVFDKDGIKAKLLKEHVGGFVDRMNIVMAAFGYKVDLDIEPDFLFVVTDTNNVLTPVKELSGSEALMWLVALQCAVSKASGIGLVVADRMDTFLPEQRKKANQVLYTLVKDGVLDQVVCIMSDTSETVPNLPNSAFFMVEAGTVRRLHV